MGGFHFTGLQILWSILKYVVVLVLIILIRNTNPRLRIDQIMKFFWGPMTILAAVALALAAVVEAGQGNEHESKLMGIEEIAVGIPRGAFAL